MRRLQFLFLAITFFMIGFCNQTAHSDLIPLASVAYVGTASEETGLPLDDETSIINSSGLSDELLADGSNLTTVTHDAVELVGVANAWATIDAGPAAGDWFTDGENDGTVIFDFDLGDIYIVDSFATWGYHFGVANGNSIAEVIFDFSTDGGATIDSSQTVAVPLPDPIDAASIIVLKPTNANFIKMTVTDNHFGGPAGGDRIGIAEIRFTTPSNVLLGDVNLDGQVNLLDVQPFVDLLTTGIFQAEADINQDGVVDLLDVAPFVDLLSG